ncbi:hypothetical protein J437_LFUL002760 [Ladona fulva]|uniref:Replication factor C subunit 3 n=1 Tax=Ladona fulva TaxID=123851 RepID=A0A8K0JYN7_LADFU|nr:hypothetical protein J437_LFUL002760 [Ladona fulva]
MNLWVDKYRPTSLDKLDYHKNQALQLKNTVNQGDFPHLLVFGPPGSGKKTRIYCLLRHIFGNGVDKMKIEHLSIMTPSKKKVDITTLSSNYHTEVNLNDVGIYDRIVVQELIKNVAQMHQVDVTGQWDFKGNLGTRLAAQEYNVCKSEDITMPEGLAMRIAQKSRRNLRLAILMCEACKTRQYPMTVDQEIQEPDWRVFIQNTAKEILKEQTPQQILKVRDRMYTLYAQGIHGEVIIKGLLNELVKNCDGQLKVKLAAQAAEKEYSLRQGQNPMVHIEAFIAKFMVIYKEFLEESVGDLF